VHLVGFVIRIAFVGTVRICNAQNEQYESPEINVVTTRSYFSCFSLAVCKVVVVVVVVVV